MLSPDLLHGYQKRIIKMSETTPHMGLFMDMGLGKTVTALTIISQLNGKTLIIGPKAVVKQVWQKEAANWTHTCKLKFALMVCVIASSILRAIYSTPDDGVVFACDGGTVVM